MAHTRVLVADDSAVSMSLVQRLLGSWDYDVVTAKDGEQAWAVARETDRPLLAILDWEMPGLSGLELCRRIRARAETRSSYLIILTGRDKTEDVVEGLTAGANDYLTKPFQPGELKARVGVGVRVMELQAELATRVTELERALAQVRTLEGLVPICSYCKKVRDDQNFWHRVEAYIEQRSDAQFSHGICPDCYENILKPQIEADEGK
jgi:DNA-binding response OmpR family regulator